MQTRLLGLYSSCCHLVGLSRGRFSSYLLYSYIHTSVWAYGAHQEVNSSWLPYVQPTNSPLASLAVVARFPFLCLTSFLLFFPPFFLSTRLTHWLVGWWSQLLLALTTTSYTKSSLYCRRVNSMDGSSETFSLSVPHSRSS